MGRLPPLVSICIPTYNRSAFLIQAVRSCVEQDYRPLELLVGDDSASLATKALIDSIPTNEDLRITYFGHKPRLGQADNLNYLMDRMRGDYYMVLHDDDMLVPGAVDILRRILGACPQAVGAFGLQYVVDEKGNVLCERTRAANRCFSRTPERAGMQRSIMASALMRQFPNDGFMLRRIVAEKVRYRSKAIVGTGCDFDFGIQVAKAFQGSGIYFVYEYTSKYRISAGQISANPVRMPMLDVLTKLEVKEDDREHLTRITNIFAVRSVYEAIMNDERATARRIFFSSHFPSAQRFSAKGFAFLLAMFLPPSSRVIWCFMCKLAGRPALVPGQNGPERPLPRSGDTGTGAQRALPSMRAGLARRWGRRLWRRAAQREA